MLALDDQGADSAALAAEAFAHIDQLDAGKYQDGTDACEAAKAICIKHALNLINNIPNPGPIVCNIMPKRLRYLCQTCSKRIQLLKKCLQSKKVIQVSLLRKLWVKIL